MKFNRKIMQVEAFQWRPEAPCELPWWFQALKPHRSTILDGGAWIIDHGADLPATVVLPTDWVTRDRLGQVDVVSDVIFQSTYEAAQ
jgi:hypothetical protein